MEWQEAGSTTGRSPSLPAGQAAVRGPCNRATAGRRLDLRSSTPVTSPSTQGIRTEFFEFGGFYNNEYDHYIYGPGPTVNFNPFYSILYFLCSFAHLIIIHD